MRRAGYCCKLFKKGLQATRAPGSAVLGRLSCRRSASSADVSSHENEVIGMRFKPRDSVQNSIPFWPSRRRSGSNRAIRLCEAVSHTESEAIGNRAPAHCRTARRKFRDHYLRGGCTIVAQLLPSGAILPRQWCKSPNLSRWFRTPGGWNRVIAKQWCCGSSLAIQFLSGSRAYSQRSSRF